MPVTAFRLAGRNYLLPIGFKRDGSVENVAVGISTVLDAMKQASSAPNFVILDAAYDNRFRKKFGIRKPGLAPMRAPAGTVIAFSAAPDNKAFKTVGDNSNYSKALVKIMETKGTSLSQLFQLVRMNVMGGSKNPADPMGVQVVQRRFLLRPFRVTGWRPPGTIIASVCSAKSQTARELGNELFKISGQTDLWCVGC